VTTLSSRQKALIKNIPTSKTHAEAAVKAGYPVKNARQCAYQALQQMRGRVPNLMNQLGLTEERLI
jgi:phage terminase small subunit